MQKIGTFTAAALLAASLLGPHAPVFAQPAPAAKPGATQDDPKALAQAFLRKIGMDKQMDGIMLQTRGAMVAVLVQQGKTEAQSGEIVDQYMMPEFRARAPELLSRFEDVMVQDFTPAELRAILNDENNDARRSAQAKAGQLPAHFAAAGQEWGGRVGTDVFTKNQAAFQKLGLNGAGIVQ